MLEVTYDKVQAKKEDLFVAIQQLIKDISNAGNPTEGTLGAKIQEKRISRLEELQAKYNSL